MSRIKLSLPRLFKETAKQRRGKSILLNTDRRIPLVEAVIDMSMQKVVQVIDPVKGHRLEGVPSPMF